ncbi:nucleotide exchange factor GrpE [Candidatus Uhrbacteria bacterium]|nr:nucleotide exchange factor GrpE [Candidatus Uhrbacteria bacterium]
MDEQISSQDLELKRKIEELEQKAEENLAGWKRSKADYLNLQKDIERNKQNWIDFASLDLIKDLLPFWISFSALVQSLPSNIDGAWMKGLKLQHKMFEDLLKKQGVSQIESVGLEFDPEWHEAVGREKAEGAQPNTVLREIAPGFKMNNKLIIPPKVIVAE